MASNIVWRARKFYSTLPREFDVGAYDGIIEGIRRQGFFDALGGDLVPGRQDHGGAYEFGVNAAARAEKRRIREDEEHRLWVERAAARAAEVEALRQRIAAERLSAEEARRVLEAERRDRVALLIATGRVRNRPIAANGSLTCACGLADQAMILPVPDYDNVGGRFTHLCGGCGMEYDLGSRQLAGECAALRELADGA
jgi:hypothetical protein